MPNWKGNNWKWEKKNINSKRHLLTYCHIPVFHVSFTYYNLSFVQEKCQSRFLCRRQGFWNGMCVFLSSSLSSLLPPFFLPSLPSLLASFLPSLLPSLAFVKKMLPYHELFSLYLDIPSQHVQKYVPEAAQKAKFFASPKAAKTKVRNHPVFIAIRLFCLLVQFKWIFYSVCTKSQTLPFLSQRRGIDGATPGEIRYVIMCLGR